MKKSKVVKGLLSLAMIMSLAACGGGDDTEFDRAIAESEALMQQGVNALPEERGSEPAERQEIKRGPRYHDRIFVNRLGPLREVFNDSNYRQYAFAEQLGIAPIHSLNDAYNTRRPLVKIESTRHYTVDSLTHSMPYLVPEAARLLDDVGKAFIDSLASRGADGYKIIVTSMLRSPYSVKRLRRVNRNATDSSTHQMGTTFDLSWRRFDCLDTTRTINEEDLKNLLAEVLYDLRSRGRCLVKYERHTACFHITATK